MSDAGRGAYRDALRGVAFMGIIEMQYGIHEGMQEGMHGRDIPGPAQTSKK